MDGDQMKQTNWTTDSGSLSLTCDFVFDLIVSQTSKGQKSIKNKITSKGQKAPNFNPKISMQSFHISHFIARPIFWISLATKFTGQALPQAAFSLASDTPSSWAASCRPLDKPCSRRHSFVKAVWETMSRDAMGISCINNSVDEHII